MNRQRRKVYSYTYKNPKVFSQRRRRETGNKGSGKKVLSLLLALLAIFIVYYALSNDYLRINKIVFKNDGSFNNNINELIKDELSKNKLIVFKNDNYILLSTESLGKRIKGSIPEIRDIKIVKKFPRTLEIETTMKQASIGWESQAKKYLLDEEGYVLKETDNFDGLLSIRDVSNLPVKDKERVVYPNFIYFVKSLDTKLREIPVEISSIDIKETTFMLDVVSKDGYKIIFETSKSIDDQINKLKETLNYLGDARFNIDYIDVTVKNKAIYKAR